MDGRRRSWSARPVDVLRVAETTSTVREDGEQRRESASMVSERASEVGEQGEERLEMRRSGADARLRTVQPPTLHTVT